MSVTDVFWLCVGLLTSAAAAFVLPPLVRALPTNDSKPVRYGLIAAGSGLLVIASVGLYQILGDAQSIDRSGAAVTAPHPLATPGVKSDALESVTERLATRLRANGGTDADWDLLAQAYAQSGNEAGAAAARMHQFADASSTPAASTGAHSKDAERYRDRVAKDPRDGGAWAALAQIERAARNFAASNVAFERAIELNAMSANDWADYADALASASGTLSGPPAKAIAQALALDARHTKALWLSASLALEEHRYPDALKDWRRLRALMADSSPDARIIDANIEEAAALSQGKPAVVSASSAGSGRDAVAIRGAVDIDPALKSRLTAGMTLFVFAKSVDAPGAPLAVLRTRPSAWPVSFQLDDSLAMLPERRLSGFDKVIVEARLSKSGQAAAQPGDLQTASTVVRTGDVQSIALRISRIIS